MMKTNYLMVLFMVLLTPIIGHADNMHDPKACEAATTILCGTTLNDQSNVGYVNKLDNYACTGESFAADYKGSERIYRLEVITKEIYNFTLDDVSDIELNYDIFLMEGSCETARCIASSTNSQNKPELIEIKLNPGVYYLIVDTWKDEFGTFDLSVSCSPPDQPVFCDGASIIRCGESLLGSTIFSKNDFDSDIYNCYDGSASFAGSDNIYVFHKEHTTDHIQIKLITENKDLNIILVSNCGSNGFSCILTGSEVADGKIIDEGDFGLLSKNYYIIVDGATASDNGEYELVLNCGGGDDERKLLECNAPRLEESLATGNINKSAYTCGLGSGNDRFSLFAPERNYYFDVPQSGEYTIRARDIDNVGLEVFLYNGIESAATCMTAASREGENLTISSRLSAGRYIVVVDGKKIGKYDLELFGCPCDTDGELTCEEPITDNNAGGGNTINSISGECTTYAIWTKAQDKVYGFTAPESQYYTFSLSDMERDLDLFLLRDCMDPESCLGFSTKTGSYENIVIYLGEGERIYTLVDGSAPLITTDYILSVSCEGDVDGDGITDEEDNCPLLANMDQLDTDEDGLGNICDEDDDGDDVPDNIDCAPLDATISTKAGDSCDDGNDATINDRINTECNCEGQADTDRDGVIDDLDQCPNTPTGAVVNEEGCSDADSDGFFPGAIGDLNDPDDLDPCVPDDSSIDCQSIVKPIQISVENGVGNLGDTVCVDVVATDFVNVASTSFSITIDNDLAKMLSITNVGFTGGTFTGSLSHLSGSGSSMMTGSGTTMTGSGTGSKGFVVWSADPGQTLTLGTIAPLVEVCVEIVTDTLDKAIIAIDSCIKDVEFFDIQANPYMVEIGNGMITREGADSMMNISGTVRNTVAAAISGVEVGLTGSMEDNWTTASDGQYAFSVPSEGDYVISPKISDAVMENISLMDILVFRKHFVYRESFTHPYQYIAADIDGNGKLSIRDELLLKNMVLGLDGGAYPYFTFVTADHAFGAIEPYTMTGTVFEYPSTAEVSKLGSDMEQDFVAIRKGDLDGDLDLAIIRSKSNQVLHVADDFLRSGNNSVIEIKSPSNIDLAGMILALNVDASIVDINTISTSIAGVDFDYNIAPNGGLIISIVSEGLSTSINKGETIVRIEVIAKQNALLSEALSISSEQIASEMADSKLELSDLQLAFKNEGSIESQVSLFPNPTNRLATLEVHSRIKQSNGVLNIYDISGRNLKSQEIVINKGKNTFTIDKQELNFNKGVIYYDLSFGDQNHQGKLIIVE